MEGNWQSWSAHSVTPAGKGQSQLKVPNSEYGPPALSLCPLRGKSPSFSCKGNRDKKVWRCVRWQQCSSLSPKGEGHMRPAAWSFHIRYGG